MKNKADEYASASDIYSDLHWNLTGLTENIMVLELLTENYDVCCRRYGREIIEACLQRTQNYLEQYTEEISLLGRLAAKPFFSEPVTRGEGPQEKERN